MEPIESLNIVDMINTYGFPIIACIGLGYFIYYVWHWVTDHVDPGDRGVAFDSDPVDRSSTNARQ
jgi:hypothetical protein